MTQITHIKKYNSWYVNIASALVVLLSIALFNSVALTNLAVLGLLLLSPFAWREFRQTYQFIEQDAKIFLALVLGLCVWDVLTNLIAGQSFTASMSALLHDMRTFGFVVVMWAVFVNPQLARIAFWSIGIVILVMASVNLALTFAGFVKPGEYFTTGNWHLSHMSHMYGQALVGVVFVLAQMWLVRPSLSWRVLIPVFLLLVSLFLASERRTGWVLFFAGLIVWLSLNAKRLLAGKSKWLLFTGLGIVSVAFGSDVVQKRMALAVVEFNQFLSMTPQERSASVLGSVSIRMQYVATMVEAIRHSNWWIGGGSINLPQVYQAAATSAGVTPEAWATYNWNNPHNEYLYMLATKGVVGLALYLGIFAQACRMAWHKTDEVQRIGLLVFVFLFMLSITTNSMMIDMEEGHFTMLILLIFLAPKSLDLIKQK